MSGLLYKLAEIRIKYRQPCSSALIFTSVVLIFLSLIWLIIGFMFVGIDLFDHKSKSIDWAFAELAAFIVIYFIVMVTMGGFGISLGGNPAPKKYALALYGIIMFVVIAIPMWA